MRGPSFWTGAGCLIGRRMGANSLLLWKARESGLPVNKSTPIDAKIAWFHAPFLMDKAFSATHRNFGFVQFIPAIQAATRRFPGSRPRRGSARGCIRQTAAPARNAPDNHRAPAPA